MSYGRIGDSIPIPETPALIGVGLAVGGSCLISAGLNYQRLAHIRRQHKPIHPHSASSSAHPSSSADAHPPKPRRTRSFRSIKVGERTPLLVKASPTLNRSLSDPQGQAGKTADVLIPLVPGPDLPSPPSTSASGSPRPVRPRIETTSASSISSRPSHRPSPSPLPPSLTSSQRPRSRSRLRSISRTGSETAPRTDKGFLTSPLWLFGFTLLNCGEFLNFLAYGFASPSVIAPLGLVTLVANVFLAPLVVGEPFRRRDLVGVLIAILGGATVVYASKSSDQKPTPEDFLQAISQPLFIVYASISAVAIVGLAYLSRTKYGDWFVLVDLALCALAGAFTVLCTKAFSSFLNLNPVLTFKSWITYPVLFVLVITAVTQVNFVNKSLQRFESRVVIPIQYCTFALSTIIGSAVLYRDFEGIALPSLVNFVFGCVICGAGVYFLTRPDPPPPAANSPPPPSSHPYKSPLPSPTTTLTTLSKAPAFPLLCPQTPSSAAYYLSPVPYTPLTARSTSSGRVLPMYMSPSTASPAVSIGKARGRKMSLTLGGGFLLAGSPVGGRVVEEEEEERGEEEAEVEDREAEDAESDEEESDEEQNVGGKI
ncbi:hypothetical protein JCM11641_002807 [Rhodosporidiobolus odoratus]